MLQAQSIILESWEHGSARSKNLFRLFVPPRGVRDAAYRPRYIALLDISSTPRAARDAVYRPRYIAPLEYSSTPT